MPVPVTDEEEAPALPPNARVPVDPAQEGDGDNQVAAPVGTKLPAPLGLIAHPAAVQEEDPRVRRYKAMQAVQTRLKSDFEQDHPFAPSGSYDATRNASPEIRTGRSLARDSSGRIHVRDDTERVLAGALKDSDVQAREQAIADRRAALEAKRVRNDPRKAQAAGTGQRTRVDEWGETQAVLDPDGKPLYHVGQWEEGLHPDTKLPVLQRRGHHGEVETKHPLISASPNLSDPGAYYKAQDGEYKPYGGKSLEELKNHPDFGVARMAYRATTARNAAIHKEALAGMYQDKLGAERDYDVANEQYDRLARKSADQKALVAGESDPIKQAGLQASLDETMEQMADLDAKTKPRSKSEQGGSLWLAQQQAQYHYKIAQHDQQLQSFADSAAEIHARIKAGQALPGDDKMQGLIGAAMAKNTNDRAETERQANEGRQGAPPQPPAPPQSKQDESLTQSEPATLFAKGVKNIGEVSVQEMARRYGSGTGEVQPASLLKISQRSKDIDETLKASGTNISPELSKSLTAEKTYLGRLYAQRFARLAPDVQKRVADATREPTNWEIAKANMGNFAEQAGTTSADIIQGLSKTIARAGALTQPGGAAMMLTGVDAPLADKIDQYAKWEKNAIAESNTPQTEAEAKAKGSLSAQVSGAVGSFIPYAIPVARVARLGVAAEAAITGAAGALGIGQSFRDEATRGLQDQLDAKKITQEQFKTGQNQAEGIGTVIGAGMMLPFSGFARAMGRTPAGRVLVSTITEKLGLSGEEATIKWLGGPKAQELFRNAMKGGAGGATTGFGQAVATNMAARGDFGNVAYDEKRGLFEGAGDGGATLGLLGAIHSAMLRGEGRVPGVPEGKEPGAPKKPVAPKETPAKSKGELAEEAEKAAAPAEKPAPARDIVQEPTTPAQKSALAIHQGLKEAEALRQAPEGGTLLKAQLAKESRGAPADELQAVADARAEGQPLPAPGAPEAATELGAVAGARQGVEAERAGREIAGAGVSPEAQPRAEIAAREALPGQPVLGDTIQVMDEMTQIGGGNRVMHEGTVVRFQMDPITKELVPIIKIASGHEIPVAQWNDPDGARLIKAAPVNIGPRDSTVSTGTGVPTAKEKTMLAEQQRLVDEHLKGTKAPELMTLAEHKAANRPVGPEEDMADAVNDKKPINASLAEDTGTQKQLVEQGYVREGDRYIFKPEDKSNAIPKQSPSAAPIRQAPENSKGVRQENPVDQGAAGAQAVRPEGAGAVSEAVKVQQAGEQRAAEEGRWQRLMKASPEQAKAVASEYSPEQAQKAIDRLNAAPGDNPAARAALQERIAPPPKAEPEPVATGKEPILPAQMNRDDLKTELINAGIKEIKGVPVADAPRNQLSAAVGELRKGKPDLAEPVKNLASVAKAIRAAKIYKAGSGELHSATPATPFVLAYDGALEIAATTLEAGQKLADAIQKAIDHFKEKYPQASAFALKRLEHDITEAHGKAQEEGAAKASLEKAQATVKEKATLNKNGVLDEVQRIFAPQTRGPEARMAAGTLREHGAELAQRSDQAAAYLDDARKTLDKMPDKDRWGFVHAVETGAEQSDGKLQPLAEKLRTILDTKRDEVQALGTGALEHFIEDYFPHIWKNPEKAITVFQEAAAKRPLEGGKSFLKQRTIPTTKEGMALGLEPVSSNPVDLALLRAREMDKYILAHKTLAELKGKGMVELVRAGEEAPAGYKKIEDRIATVYGPRTGAVGLPEAAKEAGVKPGDVKVFGRRIMGEYYAPEAVAQVVNNYLSPGLRHSQIFRGYLSIANSINQFQLGLSAFHLGFTSLDAATSRLAVGLEDASRGKFGDAAKSIASTPLAPFTNALKGDKVLKEWMTPGSQGDEIGKIVDGLKAAGGRAQMDKFYQTEITRKMLDNFRQGGALNYAKGTLRAPFSAVELAAKPIMEWIVPRQKLGVFADMAKRELASLAPGASRDDVRKAMGKAWDSVDNRLGQLVYDNLFWKKAAKDLSMASVRSLGWNLGTLRELGGGALDALAQGKGMLKGQKPELTHRMAYLAAMPILAGTIGGTMQYMLTGKGPEELRDYFFPKTGERDPQGRDIRLTLPAYMKDVYHYAHDPVGTVTGKVHPLISLAHDMLMNKDYFDQPIRNSDDPFIRQVMDVAGHTIKQFAPIGISQAVASRETGQKFGEQAANFVGVTRAPKWVSMSDAEQLAEKLNHAHLGSASVPTAGGAYRYGQGRSIAGRLRNGSGVERGAALTELHSLVAQGQITEAGAKRLINGSKNAYLTNQMVHLDANEAVRVYRSSTGEERRMIRDMVMNKVTRSHMPEDDRKELLDRIAQLDKPR